MAAAQIQSYTKGNLRNNCKETLSLGSHKIWKGSKNVHFQDEILYQEEAHFTHSGDSEGSEGGVVYKLADGTRWIVAWDNPKCKCNPNNKSNKVYTEITKQPVNWEHVKTNLEARGQPTYSVTKFGYSSVVEIDAAGDTPTMNAFIEQAAAQATAN